MRSLFVVILIAIGFTGSIFSRHIGLLTYVWFSLFRPVDWVYWNLVPLRLSLVSGLLLLIPSLLSGILPNITHPLSILSWLMLGVTLVAQMTSYLEPGWVWVDQFARLIVVSTLAVSLLTTRERISQFVAVLAGSFAFFSAKAGVVALVSGGVRFSEGQAGTFVDNNGYAMAVNMAIPLMAVTGTSLLANIPYLKQIRLGFLIAIPLSVLTVIGTMSRAGLLALATLALIAALLQRRPLLWTAGLMVAGVLTYNFAPMPEGYLERVSTITTYREVGEGSALSRLHFWRIAVKMAEANPLGVGLRQYDQAYDAHDTSGGAYGFNRAVHNSHLQVLSELGYAGFALWILTFLYALSAGLRIRFRASALAGLTDEERTFYVSMSTAIVASMCAFIVGGTFIAAASNELTWLTFAGLAALQREFNARVRGLAPARTRALRPAPAMPPPRRKAIA
ncbi:MAG TPA: O-antigen ligase family protein [Vicinamibacterales bacterium]|nr:O-antigen ligase family protein [Vicinamibacterales bacterium]